MKRFIKIIFVLLICLSIKTVYAQNYELRELIPMNKKITIHTNNFSYKGLSFDGKKINFDGVKNLTADQKTISISIGLFNKNGKNVGVINYCDLTIEAKEEKTFNIVVTSEYLGEKFTTKDIKYIAVLGDNVTCKTKGSRDYIGQSVEKMGISHTEKFDNQTELFLSILTIIGGALLVLIIYKLVFTKKYTNMDGNKVREGYQEYNEELRKQREEYLREHPPVEEVKETKPEEILKQEEAAKTEDKNSTDLHNLYK